MAINLQIFIGVVNYTDYLHVTAAKVASPSSVVWEDWIPVPVTNYTLVIPGLDPDDYYISFYDAPDNVSLGTLVSQCFVNARSPEYAYEVRFYEIGNLPVTATLDVTQKILTDTYLIGKTIESYFKEAFRFLEPDTDIDFDDTTGAMELLTGVNFEPGEKFTITIKYAVGTVPATNGGFYTGSIDVTASTYTMLAGDRNKRVRCVGSAATQVITLPSLTVLNVDDGFYFDNSVTGTAVQVKIIVPGTERIRYNGFMAASDEYAEFWVSKGEHLLIRKIDDDYWEVILDYKGVAVGSRQAAGYSAMPAWTAENGALLDGDEYPRLWWWINTILPSTHVITDDAVTGSYTHPVGKEGLFVKHSTLKKFRMPNTQGLSEKGLKNFTTYGADTGRIYDYPGGKQLAKVMKFWTCTFGQLRILKEDGTNTETSTDAGLGPNIRIAVPIDQTKTHETENIVENVGVIFMRHI